MDFPFFERYLYIPMAALLKIIAGLLPRGKGRLGFAIPLVAALGLYAGLTSLRLPILLIYGVVRGFGILPHSVIPQMIGALVSQFYFIPRFGARRWKLYATVLMAGFSCGMGLVGMGSIAIALIGKSVSQMPF